MYKLAKHKSVINAAAVGTKGSIVSRKRKAKLNVQIIIIIQFLRTITTNKDPNTQDWTNVPKMSQRPLYSRHQRQVTCSKFHTEDPQILGATVQNVVDQAIS